MMTAMQTQDLIFGRENIAYAVRAFSSNAINEHLENRQAAFYSVAMSITKRYLTSLFSIRS